VSDPISTGILGPGTGPGPPADTRHIGAGLTEEAAAPRVAVRDFSPPSFGATQPAGRGPGDGRRAFLAVIRRG